MPWYARAVDMPQPVGARLELYASLAELRTKFASAIRDADLVIVGSYTPQGAEMAYRILLSPTEGFQKKAQIDMEGVKNVLLLRSKYGRPQKTLDDPATYYDPGFYQAALSR